MTKVKKNNLLLTLLALLLAAVSAALIFMVAPKRAAKADETASIIEISESADYSSLIGEDLTDKIIMWDSDTAIDITFMKNGGFLATLSIRGTGTSYFETKGGSVDALVQSDNETITTLKAVSGLSDIEYYMRIPHELEDGYQVVSLESSSVSEADVRNGQAWILITEPTEPEEPSTEPEQDEPSSEPSTDEKKPFDLGAWLTQAGDDVSEWIGENIGIATSGSTVLIVGAVIIVIVIARRRRR